MIRTQRPAVEIISQQEETVVQEQPASGIREMENAGEKDPAGSGSGKDEKTGPARIVGLVRERAEELFHAPDGKTYAIIRHNERQRIFAIRGGDFESWVTGLYFREESRSSPSAVAAAINLLDAQARYEGLERPVFIRVAQHGNCIYVDLADNQSRAVEISTAGYKTISNPPVLFIRPPGTKSLPAPVEGGSLDELRSLINVPDEPQFLLIRGWLVGALNPRGPFPPLVLEGNQGSAKTSTAKLLRALIDPNRAPSRSIPRDERDLMISASNCWCPVFDNVSEIKADFSDSLCRLATGGGFATRRLYTDDEEVIFDVKRPIILNGISVGIERADLLDRCLLLALPEIPPANRLSESQLRSDCEASLPRILGALYSAVSCALRREQEVVLAKPPRMMDFAKFATAAEPEFGCTAGDFLKAYEKNCHTGYQLALDSSAIWPALKAMVDRGPFSGTPTEFLQEWRPFFLLLGGRPSDAPKTPAAMSALIKRLQPALSSAGIFVKTGQTAGSGSRRFIEINGGGPSGSAAISASASNASGASLAVRAE